jgi:xanthine/uracil permease
MLKTILDSGILLASITAVALNAYFNPQQLADGAHDAPLVAAEHV